jgi:hypothetical protein
MFYNARWYDPALGRFAQADSIVPGGVQGYDRYAYANNNSLRYTDPTGHCPWCIAVGVGAVVGAAVGYGVQVYDNYRHGVTDPLTTNISAEPIVNGAFIGAGAVLGVGLIATAPIFAAPAVAAGAACADGDCTNEARATGATVSKVANAACGGDCSDEISGTVDDAQSLIDNIVQNEFKNVKLSQYPKFDPNLNPHYYGEAMKDTYTKIGPLAIKAGRVETIITMAHEEMHHRL